MRSSSPNVRLFVAIHPPREHREAYLSSLDTLDPPPDSRRRNTPIDQVHLTLQFIGHVPERELKTVIESLGRAASGVPAFELTPLRLITLPERGTPRLIALLMDAPAPLMELRRRLVRRLARKARPEDPERFRPHLTLSRFTGGARPRRVDQEVSLPRFTVAEIVLVRSVLRPGGAVHSEIVSVELG